ncbi:hypothetical protein E4U54_007826 [Claviceps lovelessii]|nr:hypothetical protein E4U54_007826 [Claviceps lovelessii]
MEDYVSNGNTGFVVLDKATQTVVKFASSSSWAQDAIQREKEVYQRLSSRGAHPGILTYHGEFEHGIRLEFAPNGRLSDFLQGERFDGSQHLSIQWMLQAADALGYIHSAGVIHGDFTTDNIFLDAHLNLRIADFAGSSIDSSEFLVSVTPSHHHPTDVKSVQGDLFAYASAMYQVFTGQGPYASLPEDELEERYKSNIFPDTQNLGDVGRIIRNCWEGRYSDSYGVAQDIRKLQQRENTRESKSLLQRWIPEIATARIRFPQVVLCTVGAVALGLLLYRRSANSMVWVSK